MNLFQKQLLLEDDRSMAELSNPARDGVGQPLPPTKVSIEEFERCKHNRSGYCFDCVRERHNQEVLDGKYDDMDDDYASTPHPSAHYETSD